MAAAAFVIVGAAETLYELDMSPAGPGAAKVCMYVCATVYHSLFEPMLKSLL